MACVSNTYSANRIGQCKMIPVPNSLRTGFESVARSKLFGCSISQNGRWYAIESNVCSFFRFYLWHCIKFLLFFVGFRCAQTGLGTD
ncbi:hypothetical protein SAMN02927903_00951 [Flavobacterium caeni]|uniref:Uncharacterized protein n=1 Tax=Flavobacterium caeni TaxID=490189 RepID=A0A1G5E5G7_9FLAO|nr:hypothetical protein SAMN02927903_00951 [Flavobacterium caeni]